jgi:hypothetical protein
MFLGGMSLDTKPDTAGENLKILMSWVHGGTVHEIFLQSILRFFQSSPVRVADWHSTRGLYVSENHNISTEFFLKGDYDYLWNIDTDIEFQPDDLAKLLDMARPNRIVSAFYISNFQGNFLPVWMRDAGNEYELASDLVSANPMRLGAVGLGFCLIGKDVLTRLGRNAFDHIRLRSGRFLGEDVSFCKRASEAGFEVWGDPRVTVTHHKVIPLKPVLQFQSSEIQANQEDIDGSNDC